MPPFVADEFCLDVLASTCLTMVEAFEALKTPPCFAKRLPENTLHALVCSRCILHRCAGKHLPDRGWCVQPSDAEIEKLRAQAAKDLTNIDTGERKRRVIFGSILTVTPDLHSPNRGLPASLNLTFCTALILISMHLLQDMPAFAPPVINSGTTASGVSSRP